MRYRLALLPSHPQPPCHHLRLCTANLGHAGNPRRADFMSIDLSSDASIQRYITKHSCSQSQWMEVYDLILLVRLCRQVASVVEESFEIKHHY